MQKTAKGDKRRKRQKTSRGDCGKRKEDTQFLTCKKACMGSMTLPDEAPVSASLLLKGFQWVHITTLTESIATDDRKHEDIENGKSNLPM
jgi:hypothetical protein